MEPVALNNHPRTWPKDQRRDLQSRHRQLAATRSLSRPIITGTYSTKCSPPLKRGTSGPAAAAPESTTGGFPTSEKRGPRRPSPSLVPSFLPPFYICPSLGRSLSHCYLPRRPTIIKDRGRSWMDGISNPRQLRRTIKKI